jgi:esterase/lipase
MLELISIITVIGVSIGGICAIIVTRNLSGHQINAKIKKKYEEYIHELELSNKRLNGKLNQKQQSVRVSAESTEEPLDAISEIIDQIAPSLPAAVRPLLKSKKAIDFVTKYIESNPEQVKGIISKFVGNTKPTKPNPDQATEMESSL